MAYLPEHFAQHDTTEISAFLQAHPFATIVVRLGDDLWPTPLPLIHRPNEEGWGHFIGHVALANDMWRADTEQDVLVIVQGPDAYITPNWYATKAETHKVVPTWNYTTVYAWGRMTVHHDPKWKRMAVGLLTQLQERSNAQPWRMGDAPQEYLNDQLEHIVGIEIAIDRLSAKWKLNQNRTDADRAGVIAGLTERDRDHDATIRELMSSDLTMDPDAV